MGAPKVKPRDFHRSGPPTAGPKRDLPPPDKGPDQAIDLDRLVWDPEYRERIRSARAFGA